jgi:hypothetical protein
MLRKIELCFHWVIQIILDTLRGWGDRQSATKIRKASKKCHVLFEWSKWTSTKYVDTSMHFEQNGLNLMCENSLTIFHV